MEEGVVCPRTGTPEWRRNCCSSSPEVASATPSQKHAIAEPLDQDGDALCYGKLSMMMNGETFSAPHADHRQLPSKLFVLSLINAIPSEPFSEQGGR